MDSALRSPLVIADAARKIVSRFVFERDEEGVTD